MKLNIYFLTLIIIFLDQFLNTFGNDLTPSEFLQYFSAVAGINSLILSFSNTAYSIAKLREARKKNKGYNEGINSSFNKLKEQKLRNCIFRDDKKGIISEIEILINHNQEDNKNLNETNITQIIEESKYLQEINMINNSDTTFEDFNRSSAESAQILNIFKTFSSSVFRSKDSKENQ